MGAAGGPKTFPFGARSRTLGGAIGRQRRIVCIPPRLGLLAGKLVGALVGDVVITREEIAGLMENRLYTASPPAGTTKLTEWLREHASDLGRAYSSELARRRNRGLDYDSLRSR